MNIEQNDVGYDQPKKSGKKGLFACGGVGCILMLLMCGGVIGLGFMFLMPVFNMIQEAQTLVTESEEVADALGTPLTFGSPAQSTSSQDGSVEIGMDIPVSGPDGSGTVKTKMKMLGFNKWETTELKVEVEGGETIDIQGSSDFSLDVDDSGIGEASAEEE